MDTVQGSKPYFPYTFNTLIVYVSDIPCFEIPMYVHVFTLVAFLKASVHCACRSSTIEIIVLPSSVDEAEEMFTVTLSSASNNVLLDSLRNQASITVDQVGTPFGEISFLGEALAGIRANEQSTNSTVSFTVARTGALVGTLQVFFTVTRVGSTDPAELDVFPSSGSFLFADGIGQTSLQLTILADDISEMDETFAVVLTGSTGGAVINSQASAATLTIA